MSESLFLGDHVVGLVSCQECIHCPNKTEAISRLCSAYRDIYETILDLNFAVLQELGLQIILKFSSKTLFLVSFS